MINLCGTLTVLLGSTYEHCLSSLSSVTPKPGGQTCFCVRISPGPAYPRMAWHPAHPPVTKPPVWFQGRISPLDQWEGCQCFALGPDSSWVLESLLCGGLLSGCSPHPAQSLGHWTSGYWLRSWGRTAEGYQGRPLGSLSFDLCWALLLQLPRCRHLQSGCHAVEALTSWCSTLIVCLLASALSMLFTSQWRGDEE